MTQIRRKEEGGDIGLYMGSAAREGKIREALSAVGQYLSDVIPPVHAAEPVSMLLEHPPQLMVAEILSWVPAQIHGETRASIPDYMFHAVSKLHYLAHLQLIREDVLTPYLESVKRLLVDSCPAADRDILRENFKNIGMPDTAVPTPISLIYRQGRPGETVSSVKEGGRTEQTGNRHFSILLRRLRSEVEVASSSEGNRAGEDSISHLIAAAASAVQTSEEFRSFQENLKSLGINCCIDEIFRTLSRSLPGWMIASTGEGTGKSHNPAIEAMGQVIQLAENKWESGKRFRDMVQAAIEQFNAGSLARAATMLDLALRISYDGKMDPDSVARARSSMHELLDANRLRELAKDPEKHRLLRKVLNFFDEYTIPCILNRLRKEERRDRRRFFMSIVNVHGHAARSMAFDMLNEHLGTAEIATNWHFARNLLCILNDIPREGDTSLKTEIGLIAPLLRLSLPTPLIKEAIRFMGQAKCDESINLLISAADRLETTLIEAADSGRQSAHRVSLLDSTIFALAHSERPKAYARVVKHGTSRNEGMGDAAARLAYLSSQDLMCDRESIAALIQFIKSKMPRKLLGVTLQKNDDLILHAIKAVSSTPDVSVRLTLDVVASQFPDSRFGQAAAEVLEEFKSLDRQEMRAEHTLTGDLALFGIPDLLQQLDKLQATGALTLKDNKGSLLGTFSLLAGRMQHCRVGRLENKEAACQLFERPAGGSFVFQGQKDSGDAPSSEQEGLQNLNDIIAEGMRRYDDLQRLRGIVPDGALLKINGEHPAPQAGEEDPTLVSHVWQKIGVEATPEECEATCPADSYRIRKLLARWVEQGLVAVE